MVLSLDVSKTDETSNTANESSARRFVLPLNINTTSDNQNLVTLRGCRSTATIVKSSGTKPKVYLSPQHLTKEWIDLPRINYHYNAHKYNYMYGISSCDKNWSTPEPDKVNKR